MLFYDANTRAEALRFVHQSKPSVETSAYVDGRVASVSISDSERLGGNDVPKYGGTSYQLIACNIHVQLGYVSKDVANNSEERLDVDDVMSAITAKAAATPSGSWRGSMILIVPSEPGYIIRSRCLEDRFVGCRDLGDFCDRTFFGRYCSGSDDGRLPSLINAGVLIVVLSEAVQNRIDELQEELRARLNFSWLAANPPQERTLALIHGRDNLEAFLPIYSSAKALGINLVVLDRPEHWLLDNTKRHLYQDFLPIDMTIDDQFHIRIAQAVKAYGWIDGICTVSDRCLAPVARAAEMLRLPTPPSNSVAMAVNKYETRLLDGGAAGTALATSPQDLHKQILSQSFTPKYPSIVKPCTGWGSEHVYKVNSQEEMMESVRRSCDNSSSRILIETYVDGPELDVNIVLLNGEIVFFEISDDFPSPGDNGSMECDFWENTNVLPSALPDEEYDLTRESLQELLLRIGFRTGVFHLEARIQNSSMAFGNKDNLLDLRTTGRRNEKAPQCFLIEINPRPPGFPCVVATTGVYGVNMFDIHLLAALSDQSRMKALTKAFHRRPDLPNSGRAWSQIVFFQVKQGGVCKSEDACEEVLQRLTNVRSLVTAQMCFYRKGDRIPQVQPGLPVFAAFFVLTSRNSREDVIRAAKTIQENFSIPVEATRD